MNNKLKAILLAVASGTVIAGAGALDYLQNKKTVELAELNTHLLYHGLPPEGSLKNARAVWQHHLQQHETAEKFAEIINSNTWN